MPIKRLSQTSLLSFQKHSNMLAGNSAYSPPVYDLLETTLIGTNTASVTFSNLNNYSDYKHLQLRMTLRDSGAVTRTNSFIRFNSDSGTNYACHHLFSFGSVFSSAEPSQTAIKLPFTSGANAASNQFSPYVVDILDFSSSSKNTTTRAFSSNVSDTIVSIHTGLWNNTAAVTTLVVSTDGNFVSGSRVSLYGIK